MNLNIISPTRPEVSKYGKVQDTHLSTVKLRFLFPQTNVIKGLTSEQGDAQNAAIAVAVIDDDKSIRFGITDSPGRTFCHEMDHHTNNAANVLLRMEKQ